MQFNFETQITETKNAVNTAAKVAEILAQAKVRLSKNNGGEPSIYANLPGSPNYVWIATLLCEGFTDLQVESERYDGTNWWHVYARGQYGDPCRNKLFAHTTDAAASLIDKWVEDLCDTYQSRLDADAPA